MKASSDRLARDPAARAAAIAQGLYPHQVEGLAFLLGRQGAILADDMGLGKTRQAILALETAAPEGPHLVVAPASVKHNWAREIQLARAGSAPPARVHVMGAAPSPDWRGWVIVHYEALEPHLDALLALRATGVIFDEAHYLKTRTTKRSRLARRLVEHEAARPLVYLLTGTPLTSRPRDLFALLQLIQHPLGRHFLAFAKRYCAAWHNGFGWVTDGASHPEELALALQGVLLRRTKDQVLDLPPKVRTFLEVEVPRGTAERATHAVLQGLRGEAPRARLVAQLTRARHALAKAKTKATLEFVENAVEQGDKVLVFSGFDEPLQRIHRHLGERSVLLTGRTPVGDRQGLVDRFQHDPAVTVFAANLQAGGLGLNLSAARQVVFNDLDWVPAHHWQAEDRAHRIGQTASVHVTYLVAGGTLDAFVSAVLQSKARLVGRVLEGRADDGAMVGDAWDELQARMRALAPSREDADAAHLLQHALERSGAAGRQPAPEARSASTAMRPEVLERLARILSGTSRTHYRIQSPKDRQRTYRLAADGSLVTCNCSGFAHRGTCSHARELRQALEKGDPVPAGYDVVDDA